MLPSLVAMLVSHRQALRALPSGTGLGRSTATAAAGYFFVWALLGAAVYPFGALVVQVEMRWMAASRAVPVATGGVFLIAGAIQLSAFKARWLCRCRDATACGGMGAVSARSAWRCGLRLGLDCSVCCSTLMAILLVGGVMDVALMALVAVAITAERLSPNPRLMARAIGVLVMAAGAVRMARALGGT